MFDELCGRERNPIYTNVKRPTEDKFIINDSGINVFFIPKSNFVKCADIEKKVLKEINQKDKKFDYVYSMAKVYLNGSYRTTLMFVVGYDADNFFTFDLVECSKDAYFASLYYKEIKDELLHEFNYLTKDQVSFVNKI